MLIGLVGAIYGLLTYINQLDNMQICNSVIEVHNQTIGNICNKIPNILTIGIVFELTGTLSIIIGIALMINTLKKKK
jgi:mannose/fructose/N-acetylgalactosamine-specific phosphotransferase system component IIC